VSSDVLTWGLANSSTETFDFSDISDVLSRCVAMADELAKARYPVRVEVTHRQMALLLTKWGMSPLPNECGIWPTASWQGMPICYGKTFQIVYSDGTVEPLGTVQ